MESVIEYEIIDVDPLKAYTKIKFFDIRHAQIFGQMEVWVPDYLLAQDKLILRLKKREESHDGKSITL